jgi:CubicO group peptidase (beta-lactamase class C family)
MHGHGRSIRLLAAALWLTACSHAPTVDGGDLAPVDTLAAYWPGATWRSAEPAAVGMDGAAMQAVASRLRAGAIPGLHAFIVVRHGWVVAESYFAGTRGEDLHTLQSVSKSVTSLLVGIAQDRGELASIDAPLLGFFPEYPDVAAAADARKRAVRLRDVLAMRSGISFWEEPYAGSPLEQLNGCRCDWLRLVLDRPMAAAPDAAWSYNSGAVITLGGVLYVATGMPADAYARQVLFAPLGITASSWSKGLPNGLPHMGGGLALRPIDVARIGYLVLRRGRWNDRQVV